MSLLLPELGLLFWMVLSFGIVFFIVAKWGFPVITRMVEERKEYIDKSLEAADEVNRRLAEMKTQSEALLEEARAKQLSMLRETARTKEELLANAKETAQRETHKIVEEAQKQVRMEREAALVALDLPELRGLPPTMDVVTAPLAYIRLHGRNKETWWGSDNTARYDYLYTDEELKAITERIKQIAAKAARLVIFFNNHTKGRAVINAEKLFQLMRKTSLWSTNYLPIPHS